jgi:hypothetical protein
MKRFELVIALMIVIASTVLCGLFISHSFLNQKDKTDRAVLNHVRYGLFSVEEWKKQLTVVLAGEINNIYLKKTTERELRKRLEGLLNTLIDKVYERIKTENSRSAEGKFKQSFITLFIDLDDIKKGIPDYADALLKELTKAKTRKQVKALLNRQLERYIGETFDLQDTTRIRAILERTGSADVATARARLEGVIAARRVLIRNEALLLAVLTIVLFVLSVPAGRRRRLSPSRYILLLLSLAVLLTAGVTTPMIDMEASISRMGFVLLGHPIQFENQVLYFQSKSILDVFRILIVHTEVPMKFVGVLLITFSVLFPLLKLAALPPYYYDYRGARKHPVIGFFAVRSGKWSMADVMVIAIFMAYIGFNGIISSQFGQLSAATQGLDLMTTNGTSLQPGYYLFLAYILLSMICSSFLAGDAPERTVQGNSPDLPS